MDQIARPSVAEALKAKPDGILESIAAQCGVPLRQVFDALPDGSARGVEGSRFEDLWNALGEWGEVLFIVHTADIVLECVGKLPLGTSGHGYFNIHGDSPIGGHIKAGNCTRIALVDRQFHGRRSCSVQFFNAAGEAMFKVFVRRDEKRELIADQVVRFEALKRDFA